MHLIKLCVGVDSLDDLRARIGRRAAQQALAGSAGEIIHRTRQMPRRRAELLDGGSIYWVIKGMIQARQTLVDIRAETDREGHPVCALVLSPCLVPVQPRPRRAFQGWRYMPREDAPPDLGQDTAIDAMPSGMRAALAELALI